MMTDSVGWPERLIRLRMKLLHTDENLCDLRSPVCHLHKVYERIEFRLSGRWVFQLFCSAVCNRCVSSDVFMPGERTPTLRNDLSTIIFKA